ncbi:M1 family metallopeptidase [Lysobacter solisilvae]|uniref:Aminopeptidase N n=2 Tax=Agrilutibacter solisilvae TaxID=2763317 RepID=A0A975AU53_9GAMM|nr:M1 family metallopeptidase [Lysobacter solisilvae]
MAPLSAAAAEPSSPRSIDVLHYEARLRPDIPARRLDGRVRIDFRVLAPARTLQFDAGELAVTRVRLGEAALPFERTGHVLRVHVPESLRPGSRGQLAVDYAGTPRYGLEFHPERDEVYTIFSTSQWLVCVDAPDERATLTLSLELPAGLRSAGNGRLVSVRAGEGGRSLHRWRLVEPMPSYVYGFAAARYAAASERVDGIGLHYLAIERSPDELRRVFGDTARMLRFFGMRAGRRYRGDYTQALVASTVGQELAGLSLLSEEYGRRVLDDPTAQALIAHEAAHQWWGNRVTCRDWGHFWLNEGMATFMAAAWIEQRFGPQAYRAQVERWHERLQALRSKGADHALVYAQWTSPSGDDRAVVYQKGAYVLHLLREQLGEEAFWRGVRTYSRAHDGRSVTTADFRAAMETTSGQDLGPFFREWVEGPPLPAAARR